MAIANGDCDAQFTVGELRDDLGRAETSAAAQDLAALQGAVTSAREALRCLDGLITPEDAAHVHRVEALAAFVQRDYDDTVLHYRSVIRLKPSYNPPSGLAPEGGPLSARFGQARDLGTGTSGDLPPPATGEVWVDGTRTTSIPAEIPYIIQIVASDGRVVDSALVDSAALVPTYPTQGPIGSSPNTTSNPALVEPADARKPGDKSRRGTRRALLWTGAGLALAGSGGCVALAAREANNYTSASPPGVAASFAERTAYATSQDQVLTRHLGFWRGAAGLGALGLTLGVAGAF